MLIKYKLLLIVSLIFYIYIINIKFIHCKVNFKIFLNNYLFDLKTESMNTSIRLLFPHRNTRTRKKKMF